MIAIYLVHLRTILGNQKEDYQNQWLIYHQGKNWKMIILT